jgi:hypothetical protein
MNNSSQTTKLITFVILFAGLIGLYYLYQYLFGPKTGNSYTLLSAKQSAIVDAAKPITITSNQLPALFDGGEFTVSTWIYVNKWSHRSGFNKSILSIGGSSSFDTIRIYLGPFKPTLHVKLHTRESASSAGASSAGAANTAGAVGSVGEALDASTRNATFNVIQTSSGLLNQSTLCDLPEVDLQRWINITVAVNGRTVDVYLDGKLSRSCVLPSHFKVSPSGYSAYLLGYGGFGGMISTTTMYDAALNPERVYQNYMAGPEPITSIGDWFGRFFAPGISISVTSS